jgi:hypothetical protein
VRHQAADRARAKQVPGHATEDPLAKAAVSVSASHNYVGTVLLRELDQLGRARSLLMENDVGIGVDSVPRQIVHHVVNLLLRGTFLAWLTDFNNRDSRRLMEQWK